MNEPFIILGESGVPEADFIHSLKDTLLLLGCKPEVAFLVKKLSDRQITREDFIKLVDYNCELFNLAKLRLAYLNTAKIKTADENQKEDET